MFQYTAITFGNLRPPDIYGYDESSSGRPDDRGDTRRGPVRRGPPGLTRHGEDDARDDAELQSLLRELPGEKRALLLPLLRAMQPRELVEMRAEHRVHFEANGEPPNLAALGPRLPRYIRDAMLAALRVLCNPVDSSVPPPERRPASASRRRESERSNAHFRGDFSARAEWRDNEDEYYDRDIDSTSSDMTRRPRHGRLR